MTPAATPTHFPAPCRGTGIGTLMSGTTAEEKVDSIP